VVALSLKTIDDVTAAAEGARDANKL